MKNELELELLLLAIGGDRIELVAKDPRARPAVQSNQQHGTCLTFLRLEAAPTWPGSWGSATPVFWLSVSRRDNHC
jgi:hypothetical protein